MTDHQPEPDRLESDQSGCLPPAGLGCAGVILLLPGLCSVIFTPAVLSDLFSPRSPLARGGDQLDFGGAGLIWVVGLILGVWGVWLLVLAVRRR